MSDAEKEHLLTILDAHGRSFLDAFETTASTGGKRKNDGLCSSSKKRRKSMVNEEDEEEAEEWHGITSIQHLESVDEDHEDENDDFEHTDDEIVAGSSTKTTIVFSDSAPRKPITTDPTTKAQMKAFMSSKISKVNASSAQGSSDTKDPKDIDDDRTNAQNDALLHKLVHTKLLSGSLNSELDMSPAKRRKALAGRVLELSGSARLGKGEKLVREAERNQGAKRVREGISQRQREKQQQELEEAKNLGNYHPTLKKVFESSSSAPTIRKREKGLGMGVGRFSNGSLRLSKEDVDKVADGGRSGFSVRSRGRGRGGGRGGRGHPKKHK